MQSTRLTGGLESDWRTYDSVAEAYERTQAGKTGVIAADLVQAAGVAPGAVVLDVGAGTGVVTEAAAAVAGDGGFAVGIDRSFEMVREGRKARGSARLVTAEAIDLPFRDQQFDVVTAAFVLSHFTKLDTALFDMIRVLRKGGRLAAAVWGEREDEFQRTWRELCEGVAGKPLLADAKQRAMPWEDRLSDKNRLDQTLRDAGLRPVRVERREYHFRMSLEDYVSGRETTTSGRFLREMLGPRGWEGFRARARSTFTERFPDPISDYRDALLGVGTRP